MDLIHNILTIHRNMAQYDLFGTKHNTTYSAIDQTRPKLSATGKTVFVTDGGYGIGVSIVMSFAQAGARTAARL